MLYFIRFWNAFSSNQEKEMMHKGIDFKPKKGTAVLASANGKVIKVEYKEGGYGKLIVLGHTNGYPSLYAQLSEYNCAVGNIINQVEPIRLLGILKRNGNIKCTPFSWLAFQFNPPPH